MNNQELECDCTGCNNIATHTWSGHPTCNACSIIGWRRRIPDTKSKRGIDMTDNHKKLVKLAATYSLSCDGWVPVKVADWNNHDKLTEENARLREALTELVQLANHPLTVDALDITQSTEMDRAKKLLKGDE